MIITALIYAFPRKLLNAHTLPPPTLSPCSTQLCRPRHCQRQDCVRYWRRRRRTVRRRAAAHSQRPRGAGPPHPPCPGGCPALGREHGGCLWLRLRCLFGAVLVRCCAQALAVDPVCFISRRRPEFMPRRRIVLSGPPPHNIYLDCMTPPCAFIPVSRLLLPYNLPSGVCGGAS